MKTVKLAEGDHVVVESTGVFDPIDPKPRFRPHAQRGTLAWHSRVSDMREALKTAETLAVELGMFPFDEELRELRWRFNEWSMDVSEPKAASE